ncbi:MAG: glycoside hydrolase family 43 protein [Candidatus Latescibacteria bacterium]|nr:glycoside hydrolase family 43 protein [Candidatus Latescibacterota bacterium]
MKNLIFALNIALFLIIPGYITAEVHTIINPVAPDGHDPWVTQKGGVYYYCYSQKGGIWVNRSRTIQNAVQFRGIEIWRPEPGTPYSKEIWAPELHNIRDRWYVYFAADDGKNENHRMYVLESDTGNALGKYTFMGKIADSSDKWAIDGTVLNFDGNLYFIWSGWEGEKNVQQNLYIARMKDPVSVKGNRVLLSQPDYDWEKIGNPLINEGPQVLHHHSDVFIIYSASGSWTDDYCLGQLRLTGTDPLNPESWHKKMTPVFGSTATVFGPGHASFTKSPDGSEDWIVYHAAKFSGAGWNRNTRMQPFIWDIDGNPCFGYPVSEGVEIPIPSE